MFKLPELSYSYDALAPHISAETMETHHSKHHAKYVENLNKAMKEIGAENMSIEKLMSNLQSYEDLTGDQYWNIRNNGGGHINHSLFFQMIAPGGAKEPQDRLLHKINLAFGNFEEFKAKFKHSAMSRFGSGWAWLLIDNEDKLFVKSTSNQDAPISSGKRVLLGVDVWEHAYYIDYRNRRSEYIDRFFELVNWDFVMGLYEKHRTR